MKKIRQFLSIALLVPAVLSCGKKNDPAETDGGKEPPKELTISQESFNAEVDGGTIRLTVSAPSRPKAAASEGWIHVTDGVFKNYSIIYTVSIDANQSYSDRAGAVSVTSGSLSKTLSISQPGMEAPVINEVNITKTLVTQDPTPKVQALYDYLLTIYGKKTISSIMADVNWNTKEADKVFGAVGKHPAMNCYDFIHIYVPKNNWIDYTDLTPVTSWYNAGGIVSLMWHFNVPVNKDTQPGTDGSGVTCTPGKTTFRAANALKDGTWENAWYIQETDKVADIILRLQELGIPAIWRPYHEAAGNAYAKAWSGSAWFWWGFDGEEVYKQLWEDMFRRFNAKGIRNLIWVWTAQNFNGDSNSYDNDADYYPGDDFVDIIARDIYGDTPENNAVEFVQLQNQYNTKMITLGECGHNTSTGVQFPEIPDIWAAGANWSWFMPWYGSSMPDTVWWKAALDNANVITRESLPKL
ncbi:MAG: hypothetical protein J5675_02865 [Bacteroidales bacterium]|nr:hypothetical protein [Bacteroidales bacterium]